MRKTALAIFLLLVIYSSRATTIIPKDPRASDFMIPLFTTGKIISLEHFSRLTAKEFKLLTGRKMRFNERFKLKTSQFFVKKMIRDDGTLNVAKMNRFGFFGRWHWHWGGFALGFLLILGPIITLFFHDDYKWDRFWTAFNTMSILIGILAILVAASTGG
jgi:hypothetical protein